MKLTGKLKTQVDNAATKEEKREAIKQAGMLLSDDELDQVSGGLNVLGCHCDPPDPNEFRICRKCGRRIEKLDEYYYSDLE